MNFLCHCEKFYRRSYSFERQDKCDVSFHQELPASSDPSFVVLRHIPTLAFGSSSDLNALLLLVQPLEQAEVSLIMYFCVGGTDGGTVSELSAGEIKHS